MKLKTIIISTFILVSSLPVFSQQEIQVIPKPRHLEVLNSKFTLNNDTKIIVGKELKSQGELLQEYLTSATLYDMPIESGSKASKNSIFISLDNTITGDEGYTLNVTKNNITITGKTQDGIFYGVQTLLQLLPVQIYSEIPQKNITWSVPAVSIKDEPQFKWRGMMLDVSRYFMTKDYVLEYIDMMAMYKMNMLHLHLVDDAGWRLEIKKYPKLTSIGSFRGEGEKRTGGYYTQEDIKEMVEYGELRGVTIVPELEFPAHVLSGIVAYPWLSCREEQLKMPEQHYISKDLICIGKESSIEFLEDVIAETCELFPSKYIHVGGDEAVYDYWNDCPKCTKVKEDNNLSKSSELQGYLTNLVAKMSAKHNRTIVGWEELLHRGEITEPVVSMIWTNMKHTQGALDLGHKVVLAPADYVYFDFPESNFPSEIKAAGWKGPISVEKCYNFDISSFENNENVLGVHGCLWTDQFIHGTILQEFDVLNENRSENYVNYLTLPRLLALSENTWTKSSDKNYENFENRLSKHYKRLDYAGFNYRVPTPKVISTNKVGNEFIVELESAVDGAEIRYTTDGSKATPYDKLYTGKVGVTQLSDLRAVTVITKTNHSIPLFFFEDYSMYKHLGTFAKRTSHETLSTGQNIIDVDFTGKISGNGDYEVTIVPLTNNVNIEATNFTVFKRQEKSVDTNINKSVTSEPVTHKISISEWQAGTPYTAKIKVDAKSSNKGNFAIFIKKL